MERRFWNKLLLAVLISLGALQNAFGIEIYGNWMGPSHPANLEGMIASGSPLPVSWDEIDDASKAHDFEYLKNDIWGDSEADRKLSISLYRIIDKGSMWKLSPQPTVGETDNTKFTILEKQKLSEREYFLALAAAMEMENQSHITLFSSVINGKLGALFKHASLPKSLVSPQTFTKSMAKYAASKLGIDRDEYISKVIDGALKGFDIVFHQDDIVDIYKQYTTGLIDDVGDLGENILDKAPKEIQDAAKNTGNDARLFLTHPKKAVGNEIEKYVFIGAKALGFSKHPKKAIDALRKSSSGVSLIAPVLDVSVRAGSAVTNVAIEAGEDVKEFIEHPKKKAKKAVKAVTGGRSSSEVRDNVVRCVTKPWKC